ncbi:MAG: hypothetical protein C4320_01465 [Armatimonadota bacterium]
MALEGLGDDDLWVRPHPRLWSVGELAGHVTYGKVRHLTAGIPEDAPDRIISPLLDPRFRYYSDEVDEPTIIPFQVTEVLAEMTLIHARVRALIIELDPNASDIVSPASQWTWGYTLEYMAFHLAYHAGQVYSVRHLLGHTTHDN